MHPAICRVGIAVLRAEQGVVMSIHDRDHIGSKKAHRDEIAANARVHVMRARSRCEEYAVDDLACLGIDDGDRWRRPEFLGDVHFPFAYARSPGCELGAIPTVCTILPVSASKPRSSGRRGLRPKWFRSLTDDPSHFRAPETRSTGFRRQPRETLQRCDAAWSVDHLLLSARQSERLKLHVISRENYNQSVTCRNRNRLGTRCALR